MVEWRKSSMCQCTKAVSWGRLEWSPICLRSGTLGWKLHFFSRYILTNVSADLHFFIWSSNSLVMPIPWALLPTFDRMHYIVSGNLGVEVTLAPGLWIVSSALSTQHLCWGASGHFLHCPSAVLSSVYSSVPWYPQHLLVHALLSPPTSECTIQLP